MTPKLSWEKIFYALVILGIGVCILTELEKVSPAVKALCGGDSGGCAQVSASEYSSIFGIALGYWGILSYIALFGAFTYRREFSLPVVSFMFGAEVYFVYIMHFVLHAYCLLCITNALLVAGLTVLLFLKVGVEKPTEKIRNFSVLAIPLAFLLFFVPQKLSAPKVLKAGDEVKVEESITSWGDPSSKFRMEVFSDFQCPYCAKYDETVIKVMENYPEIYIVFRDYVIQSHKYSPMAVSYAGSVAYFEGKNAYLKERVEIFKNQKEIDKYLPPKFKAMKDDPKMKEAVKLKVQGDLKIAKMYGITSTPNTVLVSDGKVYKKITGHEPFYKLKNILDKFISQPDSDK